MGNCTYHYFGAYLEVQLKQHSVDDSTFVCNDGHPRSSYKSDKFCNQCGLPYVRQPAAKMEYPDGLNSLFGWEVAEPILDSFADDITPSTYRYREGKLIFIAPEVKSWHNMDSDVYDFPTVTLEFPSPATISTMKSQTKNQLKELIKLLNKSPLVAFTTIKAGYALNEEY